MLRSLLSRMAAGGPVRAGALALELGIGPRQLAAMLERLASRGYVEAAPIAGSCAGHSGCAGCAGCVAALGDTARAWTLTAKGRRAAAGSPDTGGSDIPGAEALPQ
jgi:predicted ArsR family transcriptional regulator